MRVFVGMFLYCNLLNVYVNGLDVLYCSCWTGCSILKLTFSGEGAIKLPPQTPLPYALIQTHLKTKLLTSLQFVNYNPTDLAGRAIYFTFRNFFFLFFLLGAKLSQYLLDWFSQIFHQMEGICVNFLDQVHFFQFLKGHCHGNQFCV